MKGLIIFLGFIVLVSCRKEYTCECTADDEEYNWKGTQTMTRSAAEDWCTSQDNMYLFEEDPVEGWSCRLK